MKIFPKKLVHVSERLWVWMSNHFYYSDFGIRDEGEQRYSGRRWVMYRTPGTGFIERESESHSYHEYVRHWVARQKPTYWRMVMGKEPNFAKELERANDALTVSEPGLKRRILESYVNALIVARKEEAYERLVRGIKDKMGHHSNKYMVSVISHYKNKMSQLRRDMGSVVLRVEDTCSPETYEAYCEMVEAFTRVAACRRIWQYVEDSREQYEQVFFDLGTFDYIRSGSYLPVLRNSNGVCYYLTPTAMIVAHSSVVFDVLPLKDLTIVSQELAVEEPSEALLSRIGDAASLILIPQLNLKYYFNHVHSIVNFVHAVDKLKETL